MSDDLDRAQARYDRREEERGEEADWDRCDVCGEPLAWCRCDEEDRDV